jgi:hypothetical protein
VGDHHCTVSIHVHQSSFEDVSGGLWRRKEGGKRREEEGRRGKREEGGSRVERVKNTGLVKCVDFKANVVFRWNNGNSSLSEFIFGVEFPYGLFEFFDWGDFQPRKCQGRGVEGRRKGQSKGAWVMEGGGEKNRHTSGPKQGRHFHP